MILNENLSSEIVQSLSVNEKKQLCTEVRNFLIDNIPKTGGHLASNLGTVELTVALHSVFTTPEDKIVFDVGHQSYTHKIITGRYKNFDTLRSEGGISGFPRSDESVHDAFIGGHSSISISAALGIAKAMEIQGKKGNVVAVIGDGALTGGQAFEGLNNVGKLSSNLIIILNDNQMSISKNHGVIADYLTGMRSSKSYFDKKEAVKDFLAKSAIGKDISKSISGTKDLVRFALYQSNIFESLGFKYLGPINGHDIEKIIETLTVAKLKDEPCIIHIKTKKGKGYAPAEANSGKYHGISRIDDVKRRAMTYSEVMGRELNRIAESDSRICAVVAAMKYGTGLQHIAKAHPDRFFDVGIAEQHALTFSCGLASQGMVPVFAVYSTFLQRCYDQIIHDASIEKKHIVICVDRAGFVGEDGETHQGVFDVSMLTSIPGVEIFSPYDASSLRLCLHKAIYESEGIAVVRYPKGYSTNLNHDIFSDYIYSGKSNNILLASYGRVSHNISDIDNSDSLVINRIYPISEEIISIMLQYDKVLFFEEGMENGGIAQKIMCRLYSSGFKGKFAITAINDEFVSIADVEKQLMKYKLDRKSIIDKVINEIKN